jgi:hypothetical protein
LKSADLPDSFEAALAFALCNSRDDSTDCPDAESIAAYYESLLPMAEVAPCEEHLARCVKCQGQLVVMVRTDEAGLLKETVARSVRERLWIGIGAGAALAAVAAIAMVVSNRIERIAPEGAAELRAPQSNAEGQSRALGPSGLAAQAAQAVAAVLAPSNGQTGGGQTAPSGLNATPSQLEPFGPAASAIGGNSSASAVGFELSSPSQSAYWRIGADGSIRWSHDGEKWELQHKGHGADLKVGMASSAFTCWLAGQHGMILKSTDGTSWENVSSPTEANIIAMKVRSAYVATITTASGRRFKTADGGKSWLPLGRNFRRRTKVGSASAQKGSPEVGAARD